MEIPGYQKNDMWNFQGSWFLVLEFPSDLTQFCEISVGGALFSLEFPRVRQKNEKFQGGFQKSESSTPLFGFFREQANGQDQNGQNTNQNQMKNTCLLYIVFQVSKVLLLKMCKIQPPNLLYLVVFISFNIRRHHFLQIFRTSFNNV